MIQVATVTARGAHLIEHLDDLGDEVAGNLSRFGGRGQIAKKMPHRHGKSEIALLKTLAMRCKHFGSVEFMGKEW